MKILIVTAMFPPIQTGTSFYSVNLANTLYNLGHDVTVVTVSNKDSKGNETYKFNLHRIPAIYIPSKNYFKHLRFTSFYLKNYQRIKKVAIESKADVILLINHYLDIAFPAIYAAKSVGLPLYISIGTQMQSDNYFKNKVLNILDRLICGKILFPNCERIISWDSEIERYIEEIQGKKILKKSTIIPFAPNIDLSNRSTKKTDYTQKKIILGVGAVINQRNYLFQIKVFNELLKFDPKLKLRIVGHIYDDSAVLLTRKLGIAENVEFTGEIPHSEVLKELINADLHWMMLSGKYVGLGTATLEAMTLGIPSISNAPSNLFGESLLKDMDNYIYTDGVDIQKITDKILVLLNDEEKRKTIGANGIAFIEENLTWEKVGTKMIDLFNTKGKEFDK